LNVLLHICCAPCAIFPISDIRKEGDGLAGFFYNPNIHPYSEYIKRRDEVEKIAVEKGLSIVTSDYDVEKYFQFVVYNEAAGKRCPVCWWLRLERTALFARDNGFDAFTTTLLGSPYQDHETVKKICEDVAKKAGIKFRYKDFRPGFKAAHDEARAKGIYCQNYCGCIFSEKERIDRKIKKSGGRK
jgi:epoxyqueuosine reductase